jgi:hypothetical protein
MMQSGPFFTARSRDTQRRILDPLGLDAVGATILRSHLLPGITAGLRHSRYFSFLTWIAGSYELTHRRLSWASYRSRVEHTIRMAARLADPEVRGVVGIDSTPIVEGLRRSVRIPLSNRAPSAFEAQYYGASFGAMDLANRPSRQPPELRPLGRTLFQAFEDTVGGCRLPVTHAVRRLQEAPEEITVGDIELLAELFQFRALQPGEPEHEVLALTVGGLGFDSEESSEGNRNRSRVFALILAVLDDRSHRITEWSDLLEVLVRPSLPSRLQEIFGDELGAWKCFGDRQVQRSIFGGVWSVLYDWVRVASPAGDELENLKRRARELVRPHVEQTRSGATREMSWTDFFEQTAQETGHTRDEQFEYRWSLSRSLVAHAKYPLTTAERLARALRVAAACHYMWSAEERAAELQSLALHTYGGASRLSMVWMLNQLDERRAAPVLEILDWLIERCVLEQLTRVAYSKPKGTEALLIARDESRLVLTRPDATVDPLAQDTNRLEAALRLMEGLSFIELVEDRLRPTETGRDFALAVMKR